MHRKTKFWGLATAVLVFLGSVSVVAAQTEGPPFPRVMMFSWSGASPYHYAQFDWVIAGWGETDRIAAAKEINPDLVASGTMDVNCCNTLLWSYGQAGCPYPWQVYRPDGETVLAYGSGYPLANTTSYAEAYTGTEFSEYTGLTFVEAVIQHAVSKDWTVWDGWNSDGLWGPCPWLGEKDLNRDGQQTSEDHEIWKQGRLDFFQALRDALPEGKFVTGWAGRAEDYWGEGPYYLNGCGAEKFLYYSNWDRVNDVSRQYYENGVYRHMFFINNNYDWDPAPDNRSRNNFRVMRFGLATALMRDGYYGYEDNDCPIEIDHSFAHFYDEYEVPLGYPQSEVIEIRDHVYCRFFDGGAMILNATTHDATINEQNLRDAAADSGLSWQTVAGPDGHFYFFAGQQNPDFNNGQVFDEILLPGEDIGLTPGYGGGPKGDGALLVRYPNQRVITDVIIDTESFVTSPGVAVAAVNGFAGTCGDQTPGYRSGYGGCDPSRPLWGYQTSAVGQNNTVVFEAELRHAGLYRVYEYHPQVDAQDVEHTIEHADGEETVMVDQDVDYEQWNLLGTYEFTTEGPARVTISDAATGTLVAADAIRFEWAGCGNEIRDEGEACDGLALDEQTCQTLGYEGGILRCRGDCTDFDVSACSGTVALCGNGIIDAGEACDGTELGGVTCADRGFTGGTLGCAVDCASFDESACSDDATSPDPDPDSGGSNGCGCRNGGDQATPSIVAVLLLLLFGCFISCQRRFFRND
jgi:hypothetical protein